MEETLTALKTLIVEEMREGNNALGAWHLIVRLVSKTTHLAHSQVVTYDAKEHDMDQPSFHDSLGISSSTC